MGGIRFGRISIREDFDFGRNFGDGGQGRTSSKFMVWRDIVSKEMINDIFAIFVIVCHIIPPNMHLKMYLSHLCIFLNFQKILSDTSFFSPKLTKILVPRTSFREFGHLISFYSFLFVLFVIIRF